MVITSDNDDLIRLLELKELTSKALGEPLDREAFDALAEAQLLMRQKHHELVEQLDKDELTPENYLVEFKNTCREFSLQSRNILGEERHKKIFDTELVIDEELFLKLENERRHK